jgi:hypothetical protein
MKQSISSKENVLTVNFTPETEEEWKKIRELIKYFNEKSTS